MRVSTDSVIKDEVLFVTLLYRVSPLYTMPRRRRDTPVPTLVLVTDLGLSPSGWGDRWMSTHWNRFYEFEDTGSGRVTHTRSQSLSHLLLELHVGPSATPGALGVRSGSRDGVAGTRGQLLKKWATFIAFKN